MPTSVVACRARRAGVPERARRSVCGTRARAQKSRAAERLSADGRSERQVLEPGVTAARRNNHNRWMAGRARVMGARLRAAVPLACAGATPCTTAESRRRTAPTGIHSRRVSPPQDVTSAVVYGRTWGRWASTVDGEETDGQHAGGQATWMARRRTATKRAGPSPARPSPAKPAQSSPSARQSRAAAVRSAAYSASRAARRVRSEARSGSVGS